MRRQQLVEGVQWRRQVTGGAPMGWKLVDWQWGHPADVLGAWRSGEAGLETG